MDDQLASQPSPRIEKFLVDLLKEVSDPLHRRLIEAYKQPDPVQAMEHELGKILLEVVNHED